MEIGTAIAVAEVTLTSDPPPVSAMALQKWRMK
jgi:hypothetical protein